MCSPVHRCTHSRMLYGPVHKKHHEYTNELTSLILYHAEHIDDFLMPFAAAVGNLLMMAVLYQIGIHNCLSNNVISYLIAIQQTYSHASDYRLGSLILPVPVELNFAAYHRVHHLNPSRNFGLTKPSDIVWDRLLGTSTTQTLAQAML